jgi:ArsR family transcriptional regulator
MSVRDPDTRLLQALADPSRLAILRQLSADGPTCACDFSDCCADLSQPTVSHHLKVLRDAGWITGQRRGRWIRYSIRPQAIERARVILDSLRADDARPPRPVVPPRASGGGPREGQPSWRQW